MPVCLNLFDYRGKVFENGLESYEYVSNNTLSGWELEKEQGNVSEELEHRLGENSAVAQFGERIYCVPFNAALLPNVLQGTSSSIAWTLVSKQLTLMPKDNNSREIIRRLVARAIGNRQLQRGWFVEDHRFAYHWSFNLSRQLCTDLMDVYPGFVFRPYVYEDGTCAIMVDPKFRFEPKKTLRNTIDDMLRSGLDPEKINSTLREEYVIDACPVTECPTRKSPSGNCRLKGLGKRRVLLGLDFTKSPSQASIGSLIDYHRRATVCQYGGKVADAIRDNPPIAIVKGFGTKNALEYPAERIRLELKLWDLDKYQRMLVMKYIQPPMPQRYKMTENFATYANELQIGRRHFLELNTSFAEAGTKNRAWELFWNFECTPLKVGNGFCTSQEPFAGIERSGPYDISGDDKRTFSRIQMMLCNLTNWIRDDQIRKFYNDLTEGFERPHFKGLKGLFGVQTPKFSEDLMLSNLDELREIPPERQPDVILVFAPPLGKHKIDQYGFFKHTLTKKGIATQFILDDTLRSANTQYKYLSYLKNLALAIYYKVGGIPWVLSRPAGYNACYIGLATLSSGDGICASIQGFDSIGLWLGGWTEFLDKSEYPSTLVGRVRTLMQLYQNRRQRSPDKVILHKDGEIWPEIELGPLSETFGSKLVAVSVKRTPVPRMYDPHARADYTVTRGACVRIDSKAALLATTGPPLPVHGSQRPITIEIKSENVAETAFKDICSSVFDLSLLFGGYVLGVVSKPITTYFAGQALSMVSQYDITESPVLWRKAWFV